LDASTPIPNGDQNRLPDPPKLFRLLLSGSKDEPKPSRPPPEVPEEEGGADRSPPIDASGRALDAVEEVKLAGETNAGRSSRSLRGTLSESLTLLLVSAGVTFAPGFKLDSLNPCVGFETSADTAA
jgi:hypothetical protein